MRFRWPDVDAVRAAIQLIPNGVVVMLASFGIIDWTDEQTRNVMFVFNAIMVLLFYFYPSPDEAAAAAPRRGIARVAPRRRRKAAAQKG